MIVPSDRTRSAVAGGVDHASAVVMSCFLGVVGDIIRVCTKKQAGFQSVETPCIKAGNVGEARQEVNIVDPEQVFEESMT